MAQVVRHMPRPSGAYQWAPENGCRGSVFLQAHYPDDESESAKEGTAAHEMAERAFKGEDLFSMVNIPAENGVLMTEEMAEHVEEYFYHLYNIGCYDPWIFEGKISIPWVRDDQEGTPDARCFDRPTNTLHISDLKYGHGLVEHVENWQELDYAAGILKQIQDSGYDISTVLIKLHIFQPRSYHMDGPFRTWTLTYQEFLPYLYQMQKSAAECDLPNPPIRSGPHCLHCKAVRGCPVGRIAALNSIHISGLAMIEEPSVNEITQELELMETAYDAIKIRKKALEALTEQKIQNGNIVPGWGLERSTSHLKWRENVRPEEIEAFGELIEKPLITKKPMTPTQALKKGLPAHVVKSKSYRPEGKLKLVRKDAKKTAERNFGNVPNT